MDREKLRQFKQKLLSRREEMEKLLDGRQKGVFEESLRESTGELSLYDNHPGDLGGETFERGKDLALKENTRMQIKIIDDALEKMAQGSYGFCEICGTAIPEERLEAIPETSLCLDCRRQEEGQGNRHPRPLEEDLLEPPFKAAVSAEEKDDFGESQEEIMFDGEDVWRELARYGSSDTPADLVFSDPDLDIYTHWQEDRSAVEEVEALPYEVDEDGITFKGFRGRAQSPKNTGTK
ncbi:MAG: TraR/DksA C4-type zinc finger protein [Bacillota bacterium]